MRGAPLSGVTKGDSSRLSIRYELRSAEHLDALAAMPLPLGMVATQPLRTMHRDLYLDTVDESFRRRGITCRLRIGAADAHVISLRIDGTPGQPAARADADVATADVRGALSENNSVSRRIRALVDPDSLQAQLELEVERFTRMAQPDFFRRPRLELHYDHVTARRGGIAQSFHRFCGHVRRGPTTELQRLALALEAEHDLRQVASDPREHAELLLRWKRTDTRRDQLNGSRRAGRH